MRLLQDPMAQRLPGQNSQDTASAPHARLAQASDELARSGTTRCWPARAISLNQVRGTNTTQARTLLAKRTTHPGMISGPRDTQPGLLPRYDRGLPPGWARAHTHHEARREHLPIRTWPWLAGQPNVLTHERLARPPAAGNHSHRMSPGRGGRARCPAWLCRQRRAARVGSGNCSVSLLAAASTAAARPLALCEPPPFRTDWTRHRPPHRPPRSLTPGLT